MRGDIILFRSTGNLYEQFITKFTHGPFVHVAVDLGGGSNIAAHPRGISRSPNPGDGGRVVHTSSIAEPHCLRYALDWLERQEGKRYGWVNVLDSALGILGLPIYFFQRDHMDCSTLVAKYVNQLCLPDEQGIRFFDNPDLISPNDIARFFKVI